MTAEKKVTRSRVRIDHLARDTRYQMREDINGATVKRYEDAYRAGQVLPPIQVARVEGVLVLVDGWHRVAALERLGQPLAEAEITEASRQEALWMAGSANLRHGLPLKNREMRTVFQAYVRSKQHHRPRGRFKSYQQIGDDLGKRKATIFNWMRKDFPEVAAKMAGDEAFIGKGGLPERGPHGDRHGDVQQGLRSLREAFQATSDPHERGEIIKAVNEAAKTMQESGNWQHIPEEPF